MIFKPKNVCIKYDMNSVISQSGRVENAVVLHLPMKYISVSECNIYLRVVINVLTKVKQQKDNKCAHF